MNQDYLEFDVVIVGAGPAGLSCAYNIAKLNSKISVAVFEKASDCGGHSVSGAVLDPIALTELVPDFLEKKFPVESKVSNDKIYFLTRTKKLPIIRLLPSLSNDGCLIVSLSKMVKWLACECEKKGVNIFPGFAVSDVIVDGSKVIGIMTGEKGVDKYGNKRQNYEPGMKIIAKVTVLAEGTRGSVTKKLIQKFALDSRLNPQIYALGIKEVRQIKNCNLNPGTVIHTIGYPLTNSMYGGGFVYVMSNNLLSLGFAVGLDYKNPLIDIYEKFQEFKEHPFISSFLQDSEVISYGAKTIPEGGFYSMIKPYLNGCLIIGDSAGFVNPMRLKGIHLAMKSGMVAGETIVELFSKYAAKNDKKISANSFTEQDLAIFQDKLNKSWIYKELYYSRNFRQAFIKSGLFCGMLRILLQHLLNGREFRNAIEISNQELEFRKISDLKNKEIDYARKRLRGRFSCDKLTSVYFSQTKYDEQQPSHLKIEDVSICETLCKEEYGNPCQYFCPAGVYELEEKEGKIRVKINFSNCIHCKTCDIADPYKNIAWSPPEGGSGPRYCVM